MGKIIPSNLRIIINKALGKDVIRKHPNAASSGSGMEHWILKVRRLSNIKINNIFEIGANYAQDAEFIRHYISLRPKDVYVFEPHPQIISEVRNYYQFNAFDYAISNKNGFAVFHAIDLTKNKNSGISSLLKHNIVEKENYFDVRVELLRMDKFIELYKIDAIDFVKLDVEGFTYQVLEGFGESLSKVKCIQLEAEHVEVFDGERLFDEVNSLLCKNNFKMVYFEMLDGKQSDSLWIQKEYLKG